MGLTKRYLVTGGAGFIGANLIRSIAGPGAEIRVLDSLVAGRAEDLAGLPVELVVGDIRDRELVDRVMAGVQVVIALAAKPGWCSPWKTLPTTCPSMWPAPESPRSCACATGWSALSLPPPAGPLWEKRSAGARRDAAPAPVPLRRRQAGRRRVLLGLLGQLRAGHRAFAFLQYLRALLLPQGERHRQVVPPGHGRPGSHRLRGWRAEQGLFIRGRPVSGHQCGSDGRGALWPAHPVGHGSKKPR